MDDCNLEKLNIKPGKLSPVFKQDTLEYSVTVPSNVDKITLDTLTRDSGASYTISVSKSFSKFSTTVMQIEVSCVKRRHATQSALLKFFIHNTCSNITEYEYILIVFPNDVFL